MCIPIFAGLGAALGASASAAASVGTMAALSIATTAAGAGMTYAGQMQAYQNQADMYSRSEKLNRENTLLQYQQMAQRQREEQIAYAQQGEELVRQSREAFSTILNNAGDAGVYGNSVQALMSEFRRQQNESLGNLTANYQMRQRQFGMENLGIHGQSTGNLYRAYPNMSPPSIAVPIIQTGAGALGVVSQYWNPASYSRFSF